MAKGTKIATQPDGQPQGRHLTGFKGTKVEENCFCGRCNPKAQENAGKPRWIVPKNAKNTSLVG